MCVSCNVDQALKWWSIQSALQAVQWCNSGTSTTSVYLCIESYQQSGRGPWRACVCVCVCVCECVCVCWNGDSRQCMSTV